MDRKGYVLDVGSGRTLIGFRDTNHNIINNTHNSKTGVGKVARDDDGLLVISQYLMDVPRAFSYGHKRNCINLFFIWHFNNSNLFIKDKRRIKLVMKLTEEIKKMQSMMGIMSEDVKIYANGVGSEVFNDNEHYGKVDDINLNDTIANEPFKDMEYMDKSSNVDDMVQALKSGEELPPILVIQHPFDQSKYLVVDGNHRRYAYDRAGADKIPAVVIKPEDVLLMQSDWGDPEEKAIRLSDVISDPELFARENTRMLIDKYFVKPDGSHEFELNENLYEEKKKADRCLRIARRKYSKPSAYRSGAIVQCRRGKIWRGLKEEEIQMIDNAPEEMQGLIAKAHDALTWKRGRKEYAPDFNELQTWVDAYLETDGGMHEAKKTDFSKEKKSGLHGWFSRRGGGGSKGWVDCNTCRKVDGKKKCKACGRQKGEVRAKYPSCRPTPASCGTPGKGKSWGKTKEEGYSLNEAKEMKRVALLFIVIDNEALLFKRSEDETTNPGKYGMLGGGIEKNETPEEAIVREIREEAGVELKSFKPLKKYIYNNECELNVFYTNEFPIDDVVLDKNEHTSYKYFTMEQLIDMDPKDMIGSNKEIAKDYNEIANKKKKLEEEIERIKATMKILI